MPNKIERRSIKDIIDQYNSNNSKNYNNKGEVAPHVDLLNTTAPPSRRIDVTRNLVKNLIARIESGDRPTPQTPKTDYRRAYSTPNQKVTVEADMVKARVQQFMKVEPKTTEAAQPAPTKRLSLPAGNENFVSLRKNFEVKQSETTELNESEDEELIEFNFSQIVAKLMTEANYDEVDEDLDVAFSSAVESLYIFDNKQETNKINYKEEIHEGHYHVNNYEIITTEAVDFDPPANNAPQKDAFPDDPINAMIPSDCQTSLCKGDVSDLHKSNRINMDESTIKIEQKFEEILCQYGIVDPTRSDVILEEKLEEDFEAINYDPSLLTNKEVLEEAVNEIVNSNDDFETKVEFEDTKDIEAISIETSTSFKGENVEKIESGIRANEKVEDDHISIETCDDFIIQNEDRDSLFKLKSTSGEELSAEELETIPENQDGGYDDLDADENEKYAQLSVADIINRFENKNDGCQMKRSSLGHIIRKVSYYDPALLAKEILEEIINKIAWLNDDFETKEEFRDTRDVEAIKMKTTNNFKEESVEESQLEEQVYKKPEDGRISIETYDNCVIQNNDVENLSEIKGISSENLPEQAETIQENLDLGYENLEPDESQECAKPAIADLIKRFESKNHDCKRSSLGDIRANSAYFSNRGKRRSSSADIKLETGDDKQGDFENRETDINDNEIVKLSVKELTNIFDRRKEEEYQNINHLRKKLVHNEAITYAPKILDDIVLEEKMEAEDMFEIVECEENEIEKRHKELVRFYEDLFEDIGNPLFIVMGMYCAIYLATDFVKLWLYICYKMLG